MEIVTPTGADWAVFLALARREGWRVPCTEPAWLRDSPAGNAFALKFGEEFRGFGSIAAYPQSGWIGNLLVPAAGRGRGYGTQLFAHTLEVLETRGVSRMWLTASKQGRPLYTRRGFRDVGRVQRWQGHVAPGPAHSATGEAAERLLQADARAWGESREALLGPLAAKGRVVAAGETVLLVQDGGGFRILGPWYSPRLCPRENRQVLAAALAAAGPGEVVADVPDPSPLAPLLTAAGLRPVGEAALMARAAGNATLPPALVSLASLGSLG